MKLRLAEMKDAMGIAKVHVDSWRQTYEGIIPDDYLASLSYESRKELWEYLIPKVHANVIIAEVDGEIVGFASGRIDPKTCEGEIGAIYILQGFQGRGIGREMMQQLFAFFEKENAERVKVEVLSANKSASFYGSFGGREYCTKDIEIADGFHEATYYEWTDYKAVLEK
ncbi:GNAT family N-acetyltransferase [Paenalkalicoccus suaedae]|uniref:GNAT family N-acetyltransferase n=1 Tax=Paenalkalicoccus suaedae TaxID=2592382 RepID=A0A859FAM4_9BACI|nr:GNAT family N-acetyltransferase [Paenalkalicoccus suaedae]QKS69997.1 GNAT family N-acetyltransferase [Paenalkalicoccus suaedae]